MTHVSLTPRNGTWPAAVVFDFDGLLADTAGCWRTAYHRCLRRRNRQLDQDTLSDLAGASVASAAERLRVPRDELLEELSVSFRAGPISAMPGAMNLVRALTGGVEMGVATNGPEDLVRLGLAQIRVDAAFATVISAERVAKPKPAPDVYLAACSALGVDPSDAVAIEDSAAGAEAARSAGMIVVCVPSPASALITADLRATRLDDPVLMNYLGVDGVSLPYV